MTPTEINQLAAARMLVATLHNALKEVLENIGDDWEPTFVKRIHDVLDHNEPSIMALLQDAASAAKYRALKIRAQAVVDAYSVDPAEVGSPIRELSDTLRTLP